ncbi:hypothetical protein FNV43_RR16467 [Rhamnella rubrinervis]|uniref:Uncharacterized protein n=1 Tax=Rhamnella rubrinervis TaxID=2594499 RepID=A0A8K0MD87_9ROSA|nr:hypothetical protein FNV43_RR16467 [Rhamnella rubrinervis]
MACPWVKAPWFGSSFGFRLVSGRPLLVWFQDVPSQVLKDKNQGESRILKSMEPDINAIFNFAETSKDLWDSLKEMYGHQNNAFRIFEL